MRRFVAEDPIRSCSQPVEQPLRPQKVYVGERGEEKQPLNARREADQIEQKLAPVVRSLKRIKILDRVDPFHTKFALLADRWNILDRGESLLAFVVIGDVRIQKC